jgi:hypothetical protein
VGEAVGPTGLLVPPRDPERFAEALARVLTDHEFRRHLGKSARERALSLFTLERMTALYRSAYEAAIYAEPFAANERPISAADPIPVDISYVPYHDEQRAAGGRP